MPTNHNSNYIVNLKNPWLHNQNPIWLASTVSLQRNIEKYKFPGKLDVERKKQIVNLVGRDHLGVKSLVKPKLIRAEELNTFEKEYLLEHFLSMNNIQPMGSGEAFIFDDTGETMTIFNLSDHLMFYKLNTNEDLEGAWSQLVHLENELGIVFSYSFSQKFGFLTSEMSSCGTALLVTTYLQLPALMHTEKIDAILEKEAGEDFVVMGMQGSPSEIIGDLFAIQNNYTLGLSEENIIASIRSLTSKLIAEEKAERKLIQEQKNPMIIDRVSRAFGILLYSYQIEAIEALNALSLFKLGVAMGWISGITQEEVNALFFNCRRAHLLTHYGEKIAQEEIPRKRAEYIHQVFKNVKLLV